VVASVWTSGTTLTGLLASILSSCMCVCGCVVVAFRVVALTQRTTRFVLHSCYNVSMHVPAEFFSALTIVFEL
jgi:hypothetical protein